MGLLTVWAVVYVDVRGLLLFHPNTAETEEKQIITSSQQLLNCFPCKARQHLRRKGRWCEGSWGRVCEATVAHRDGVGDSKWRGRVKEGLTMCDWERQRGLARL